MFRSMGWSRARAVAAAALCLWAPLCVAQQTVSLKIQASWPASLTIYENLTFFAERVSKLSGGTLKIEPMPAGQVVPPFEVLDATAKKVLDGAHTWAGYWVGKNKAAILFTGGPGGPFGMDFVDVMGWMYAGGGFELYQEFYRDVLKLNVIAIPILPAGPQALGWFKRPIKSLADFKGMKCRQTGLSAEIWQRMGMQTVNMPGGEIIPSAQRGVIDCAEWVGGIEDLRLGLPQVWKYHYSPGMHETNTMLELLINADVWKSFTPLQQEAVRAATLESFVRWGAKWQRQNADALEEMRTKYGTQILRTPPDVLIAFLKAWDEIAAEESAKNPFFKKVLDSQRAYARIVVPAKRFMFPPYSFAANYYFPESTKPARPIEETATKAIKK